MGRPPSELLQLYLKHIANRSGHAHRIADGVSVSTLDCLSLPEYIVVQTEYCSGIHKQPCSDCQRMLQVARIILDENFCRLRQGFEIVSPTAAYTSDRAITKLLRMPLVAVRIGSQKSGMAFTILMEKFQGTDYKKMALLLNKIGEISRMKSKEQSVDRPFVQMLLGLAQSSRERACLRVAIFKASGMSASKARQEFGFEKMHERTEVVEKSIMEAQRIREAVDELVQTQDKALMKAYGNCDSLDSSDDCSSTDSENEVPQKDFVLSDDMLSSLCSLLVQSEFNWFEFCEKSESYVGSNEHILQKFFEKIPECGFEKHDVMLIEQSHSAYLASATEEYAGQRIQNALNGDIVTDSESDNPNDYVELDPKSERGQLIIAKKRAAIKRKGRRLRAKMIAEKRFFSNKKSKRVSKLLQECPDIGNVIEKYVQDRNIGADAWRRTGVLTFDGNVHLKEKVTYERIRQHLVDVYKRNISFGTVVELCVARNKRRRSAKRYRGIARVTTRRARKGFTIKYNPDLHWSSAFYKGLNNLQYKDGCNAVLINRDDASGFRLDTLTTCKQHPSPAVQGQDILTTRTDYVNKYRSIIQTTSYNFSATNTTTEMCVGVVKAEPLHYKNPAQHAADLEILQDKEELSCIFFQNSQPKPFDCIRVDGASDEGPSHEEVQFWWTARHMFQNKIATLITTRSSGASYLNRVELQNGCLALAHSNTFIPSTLGGSCMDPQTGKVSENKLKENLSLAIDAYICRVNKAPCGDTYIHLYKGPPSDEYQSKRAKLTKFLKSKTGREELRNESPDIYEYFKNVWNVRNNHMVKGLPKYIFFLLCCYKPDCMHPRCIQGKEPNTPDTWYPEGPSLLCLPLPKPDPCRPWGGTCSSCKDFCAGHYSSPSYTDVTDKEALEQVALPPSVVLNKFFVDLKGSPASDDQIETVAKKALLPTEEVKIWLDHLSTVAENRKRGAVKAAETRRRKQQSASNTDDRYFCGTCGIEYQEEMRNIDFWICCDNCHKWYCCTCEFLNSPPTTEVYKCLQCCHH